MKKIITLCTAVALATTLGLAGCKKGDKKKDEPAVTPNPTDTSGKPADPAMKPDDTTKPADPAVKPDDTAKPADPATPTDTAASTGMPECDEYLKVVETYSKCDKLTPAAKDAAIKGRDASKSTWTGTMTDDAKKTAAAGCKSTIETLKTSAQALGCTL